MANPEHLELVHSGADATWHWRGGRLDLRDAELSGVSLRGAMLDQADLSGARLVGADLTGCRLQEVSLAGAQLIRATLNDAQLGGGRLSGALLCSASLRRAVLGRCDLSGANLAGADLEMANLAHARLAGAVLDRTKLVDAELEGVSGLDAVIHEGPSELGTHALLRYGHQMPAEFLRGVGLPDSFIRYLPSIIASARPVDFFAIYICAATADAELARRLHNDLQAAGIRCWFRHTSADGSELDDALRLHERSIVLWSEHAARDPVVTAELATSRRPGGRETILLELDDTPPLVNVPGHKFDFSRWRDFRVYSEAFDVLLKLLVADA
jgi:hypothetical protein